MIQLIEDFISQKQREEILSHFTFHEGEHDLTLPLELGEWLTPNVPDYIDEVADMVAPHFDEGKPNSFVVNEYLVGQSMMPHIDDEAFGDTVAIVSLLGTANIHFEREDYDEQGKHYDYESIDLKEGSLLIFSDEHRWHWTHQILSVKERRISLVLRKQ